MKKLLALLLLAALPVAAQNTTLQKTPSQPAGSNANKLTDPSKVIVVGDGGSISATGTGQINATSVAGGSISPTAPLTGGGPISGTVVIGIPKSTSSVDGYLFHTDWTTFNSKQAAGNYLTALTGDASAAGPGSAVITFATVNANVGTFAGLTVNAKGLVTGAVTLTTLAGYGITDAVPNSRTVSTTAPLTGGGVLSGNLTLAIPSATSSVNGYLTSADWTTFNSKQAAGNYLTALTGDVSAAGPGSAAATLATVASAGTTGSSTAIPVVTIDAKGRTTTITTAAVVAPAGTLTGTTLASNVVTSSLTTVGTIGAGVWQGTTVATGFGGTGLTSFTSGGLMQATSGSALATTLTPSGLTSIGVSSVAATGNLTLSGGSSGASAVLTTGANGQITVPEFQPFYLTPFSGDAPWRIFTSDLGGSNTDDQVLHLASNTRYLAGAWQTRDVANRGAAIFSMESNYTAGSGGNGSFEWNLDFADPGTGVPSFTTRALGFAHNWTTTANTWDFGPTGGASSFTFRGPLSVVYSNSNARQLTVNSTDNGLAALQLTSNAKSWHVEHRGGNNSNALYIGSTDFDPAIAISETTGAVTLNSTTASTTSATGALIVGGGAGIGGAINSAGAITSSGATANARWLATTSTDNTIAGILLTSNAKTWHIDHRGGTNTNQLWIGSGSFDPAIAVIESSGDVKLNSTTASTTATTGAFQVIGGAGIGGAANIGSTTDATASAAALFSNGGITALKKIWAGTGGFVGASITSPTTSDLTVVAANSGASIVAQHGASGNLVVRPGGTLGSGTEGWVDLGGPTWTSGASDGAYSYPLRWGVGNGFGLVGGFQNFTGIEDNSGGISYNPKHVAGDISVGLAFESRYLASTETYLAWTSADGLTSTRPFQSNIDWGPSYGGTTTGATIWRFDVDEFHIYARTQVGGASPLTMNMSATAGASTFAWQGGMQLFNAYLQAQATTPATPGDGNRIYSDSAGRFTLLNAAGFTTTIQNATANAVFSFPTTGGGLLVDNGNVTPNTGRYYSGADSSGGAQFATRVDKNGATLGVEVQNNSATTAAQAGVQLNNGTHVGGITQYGESFTTSGANIAGSTQLYTNSTLVLNAINGHIQIFAGNPAKEMAYLDPQFGFIVGRAGGTYANWGTSGITFNSSTGITWTRSGSAGTDATAVFNSFGQPTLAASNATTTTNAATLYIAGDVVQGTNQTLTNSYGFWNAGKTRLDGVASVRDNLQIDTAGKTILVKSGSNAAAGTVTLVAGAATITSTAIDANTVILFSEKTAGGTPGVYQPLASVSSGSAAVTSAATDISTYNWVALKVN